ncbi:MAG: hypothetical protein EON60_05405 [Alphaproteobacteria bacterium]|nr:MAG: hypothetical protein EON60_05405 [Alphaproteobacteria bacterium]
MTLAINGLQTAIQGLRTQETRVAKAAEDINANFTAAQNAIAADSVSISDRAAVIPAVEDAMRSAVVPQRELSSAIVDMLQAKTAFSANAAAVRVTSDVMQDTIDMVGKRGQ